MLVSTEVASAYVSLTANTAALTTGLAAAEAKVRGFASAADSHAARASRSFAAMGVAMKRGLVASGIAAGVALVSAVKTAADFETQLSDLNSVVGTNSRGLDALREQALKYGAATKYSASEAASAQIELAKGGLSAAQILGGALPGALALAAAGDVELARAAEIAVNTMEQFGLAADDVTGVADALAMGANKSTASVESLSQGLAAGGATAAGFGYTVQETVAALMALQSSTNGGSDAGTSLKAALNQLNNPTAKQAKLQRELGLSLHDSNGEMKSFAGLAGELERATRGMTDAERSRVLSVLAGTDGQRALLGLLRAGAPALEAWTRANSRAGTAAEVAAKKQDNLQGKLEQLGGAIETIKIRVGSALIPILSEAAVATAEWLEALGDSDGLTSFADGLADGFTAFAQTAREAWVAAQPLLTQLGGIAVQYFRDFQNAVAGVAPVLMTVIRAGLALTAALFEVTAPIRDLQSALLAVPGVAQAAAAGLVGLGAAMVAMRLQAATTAAVSFVSAWAPYVSLAAKTAVEVTRSAGAMGLLRFATAGLVSPAGLAVAAVGALAGGVTLLASGMFSGASAAQQLANALNPVTAAANNAAGAITNLKSATGSLKDAHLAEKGALLAHEAAQKRVNELKAQGKQGTLEYRQALQSEAEAARNVDKARQASARAQAQVNKQAIAGVVDLARLATAEDRATADIGTRIKALDRLKSALGGTIPPQYIKAWKDLERQGGTTNQRFSLMRKTLEGTAKELRKIGDVKGAEKLERLAKLDMAGWKNFASEVQTGMREGLTQVQAVEKAIKNLKPPRDFRLNVRSTQAQRAIKDVDRALAGIPRSTNSTLRSDPTNALLGVSAVNAALATIPSEKVVNVRVVGHWPTGSPRVYEIPELLDSIRSKTVDVTVRPHGSGELEAMERRVRAVSSGSVAGLRGRYGGGSIESLRNAVSGAGSLLIRADLDIANLPEVLAEAREVGLKVGGTLAARIEKDRKALARTVADANTLARTVENLRNLTGQLARARADVRGADDAKERAAAQKRLQKIIGDIAKAQATYQRIAGNQGAAQAIATLRSKIARQVARLAEPAAALRDRAEDFQSAKQQLIDAITTTALEQFDADTRRSLDGIASAYENGFKQIGSTFQLIPGEFRKLENRTASAAQNLQATLDREFDAIGNKYKAAGKALDARARELTAAEKRLAQIRDEQSASDIARNVQEAEAALREAYAKGMPASEIKQRQRAVEEARRAELIAGLEKTAEAERSAKDAQVEAERERLSEAEARERQAAQARHDARMQALNDAAEAERLFLQSQLDAQTRNLEAQRAVERASLERQLEQFGQSFLRLRGTFDGNHNAVLAQVRKFADRLTISGEKVGRAYAEGIRDSFPQVRSAANGLARIVADRLKLHSPAKEGPLSDLDRWWKPFGRTLLSGADMRAADALVRAYADPALGGASVPANAPNVFHITINAPSITGISRDQARDLANSIKPELDRIISIR